MNFDNGWNGFAGTNWISVSSIGVDREASAFVNTAAKFNGSVHLEIPYFSNSHLPEFATSFCYKRNSAGGTAIQGLISNGNCVDPPSISITSGQGIVSAVLATDNDILTIPAIAVSRNKISASCRIALVLHEFHML